MKPLNRDRSILEHIISYCEQIEATIDRFGDSYAVFSDDPIYRNAAALCILQIGELVGKLTEEFFPHPILASPGGRSKPCAILSPIATVPLTRK